ncbi:MAG: LuxR C-terminal-related transcriptional regulator [Gallionellaceae bacterium]
MILLASSSPDIIARSKQGMRDFIQVSCVNNLDSLRNDLVRLNPPILLLDHGLPKLGGSEGVADLMRLSPETKIIILSNVISEEAEWELFKAGARGCCQKDIDAKQLKNLITAVQQGELWIRRSLTFRVLEEFGAIASEKKEIKQAASDLLANLSQREQEIALLAGGGDNNKQIAQRLAISEQTVRAHLSEVFRKLNIEPTQSGVTDSRSFGYIWPDARWGKHLRQSDNSEE